jgi:hypothetical protein
MNTTKLLLAAVLAVVVALLGGYVWGSSGRRAAEHDRQAAAFRAELLEARGSVLAARLEIYSVNFGNAGRHLQEALDRLKSAAPMTAEFGGPEEGARLARATAKVQEAQQLAGKLDQTANARAAEAAAALGDALNGAKP